MDKMIMNIFATMKRDFYVMIRDIAVKKTMAKVALKKIKKK